MREAVVVDAVRTPVGKRNGGLADVHAADLSALVLAELVDRTGIEPGIIDDVHLGLRYTGRRPVQQHCPVRRARGGLARACSRHHRSTGPAGRVSRRWTLPPMR